MKENEIETKSSAVLHGGIPATDPNYWDCECKENYIHHKSARKECPKCGTYHEDQPDSRVSEIVEGIDIGTDAINIEPSRKAIAQILITILQDSESPKDVEWAKSEIHKMADDIEKLRKVEERVETNTILDWNSADAGAEFASIYDFIKGGESDDWQYDESAFDNSTHTDIQMSLRYDEGEDEYQVDSRFDVVRTRDGEPMGEAYETGQIFSTYDEALHAYYKLGHEYEKALTDAGWSMIGDGTVPDNPKKVFWSNEVEDSIRSGSNWHTNTSKRKRDVLIKKHLGIKEA